MTTTPTPLTARGRSGQMTFDGRMVTITHDGALAKMMHGFGSGMKMFPIKNIAAVQFKPATAMFLGYIQLTVSGEDAKTYKKATLGGSARNKDIAKDENAVLFSAPANDDFQAIAMAVTEAIR